MKYLSTELHPYPKKKKVVGVVLTGGVHIRISREAMSQVASKGLVLRLKGKYHICRGKSIMDVIAVLDKVDSIGAERVKSAYIDEHPEVLRDLLGRKI
jgi:hypothetical protein